MHVLRCCSGFKGVNLFYVVRFMDVVPQREYDVAPLPWMISNDVVEFPLYNRLKTEKMVYEMHPPTPRKDFKKYKIVLIHWTGR